MADNLPLSCVDQQESESMQSLLSDAHPWPNWWFVDRAIEHWHACPCCRIEFPEAENRLSALRRELEVESRDAITSSRKSYLATKYNSEVEQNDNSQHTTLVKLAMAGNDLGEQLWSVNTSGVPFEAFSPFLSPELYDDERTLAAIGALDFFLTLSQEDREFVVAATAISEVFSMPWRDMPDELRAKLANEEDWHMRNLKSYEWAVATSHIFPVNLRNLAELGAASVADQYIRIAQSYVNRLGRLRPSSPVQTPVLRGAFDELRSELLRDFQDFSDSMKATQNELFRILEQGRGESNTDPRLSETLGVELFTSLAPRTRELLHTSEQMYHRPRTANEQGLSAITLVLSYESELNIRVTTHLVRDLIEKGYANYPEEGEVRLVKSGKPSRHVSSGQVLRLIETNRYLQEVLEQRGLEYQGIIETGNKITRLRNRVIHQEFRPGDTQLARDLVLGPDGGLRALVPKSSAPPDSKNNPSR